MSDFQIVPKSQLPKELTSKKPQTKVINIESGQPFDVFIGRPSPFGNPFKIGRDGTREQVIEKYRQWVVNQPAVMALLPSLYGKTLGCFCLPLACHGQVLVELIEELADEPISCVKLNESLL
jgi:hypothetical protein